MEAIILTRPGGPEALRLQQQAAPQINTDHQILVRNQGVGVNPIDAKIRQAPERFPVQAEAILGCDGAGVVEQVGAAVTAFKPGDEVYYCQCGFNGRQGSYAQFAVVDNCFVALRPRSISVDEAAGAPLVTIAAWEALYERARLQAGQSVLIHGGAGGVGHVAIQLAVAKGARVITTVSSAEKANYVKSLGAERVVIDPQEDFVSATEAWTQGQGVDVAFDTVGGEMVERSFPAVKVYGDFVTLLQAPANLNWAVARQRNIRFTHELMLTPTLLELPEAKAHQGEILKEAARLIDQQRLKLRIDKTFPLALAAQAHRYLENTHPIGKVVLRC